jgi:hypothetical protein
MIASRTDAPAMERMIMSAQRKVVHQNEVKPKNNASGKAPRTIMGGKK